MTIGIFLTVGAVSGTHFPFAASPAKEAINTKTVKESESSTSAVQFKQPKMPSETTEMKTENKTSKETTSAVPAKHTKGASETESGNGQKVAYLTFDDGPSKLTPELLQTLKNCGVHATFFVVGQRAQMYPEVLKEIVDSGNVIGVHSWTHKYQYIYKSEQNFLTDFNLLKDYIKQETGVTPNISRFPGGTNNTVCFRYNKNHIMRTLSADVKNMGFQYFDWNVSSGEASNKTFTKEKLVKTVVSQCKNKHTAIILFHDTDRQVYVDAIPEIVSQLRGMGFSFDTLSPSSRAIQFNPS